MDSEWWHRWISLAANIGVLFGLGLLVVEIRQNSELTLVQIEQSRSQPYVDWTRQIASNDAIAALFAKIGSLSADGFDDKDVYERPNPVEQQRIRAITGARFYDYESLHSQYHRGYVSE